MPHKVDVRCPSCGSCAVFEFAEVERIKLKKDVIFFQESPLFDYERFKDLDGHKWHGAIYYAGLHGSDLSAIRDLPDGYSPENWAHSKYLLRSHGLDIGSISCQKCYLLEKHELSWPKEAFFSVHYKGKQMWAFNRESARSLRDYIASGDRKLKNFNWQSFLLHIPSVFKQKKAREHLIKLLDRLLKGTVL